VILAAGAATRMGRLKQLLPYQGKPLVHWCISQAIAADFDPVLVVVGAQSDAVRAAIAARDVEIVENRNWAAGMGSSIAAGVKKLQAEQTDSAATAILLADQPMVTAQHLSGMRRLLFESGSQAVAAQYGHALGVPALFKRELFSTLASLAPEAGARRLLRDATWRVQAFPLPEAAVDIDTPEDYSALETPSAC
jgi:molybdenum cofactor cytidylyltransferase